MAVNSGISRSLCSAICPGGDRQYCTNAKFLNAFEMLPFESRGVAQLSRSDESGRPDTLFSLSTVQFRL